MGGDREAVLLTLIDGAPEQYHRLILVVGPPGSGKTSLLRRLSSDLKASLVNVGLELARSMINLTERQRALRMPDLLRDVVSTACQSGIVLLDNTEILFDTVYRQDPLSVLQRLARDQTVVASWSGVVRDQYLTYAAPEHREYRRYPTRELMIVNLEPGDNTRFLGGDIQ